jgi:hypothetical protein
LTLNSDWRRAAITDDGAIAQDVKYRDAAGPNCGQTSDSKQCPDSRPGSPRRVDARRKILPAFVRLPGPGLLHEFRLLPDFRFVRERS